MVPKFRKSYLEAFSGSIDVVTAQLSNSVSSSTSDATFCKSASTLVPFLQIVFRT
jgi:hypothetical protein